MNRTDKAEQRVVIGRMSGTTPTRIGRALGGDSREVRAMLDMNHPGTMWAVTRDRGGWLLVEV